LGFEFSVGWAARFFPDDLAGFVEQKKVRLGEIAQTILRTFGRGVVNVEVDEIYAVTILGFESVHDGLERAARRSPYRVKLDEFRFVAGIEFLWIIGAEIIAGDRVRRRARCDIGWRERSRRRRRGLGRWWRWRDRRRTRSEREQKRYSEDHLLYFHIFT
jgi:hypothetical protein